MSRRRQRGVALLVVMWACTLLAILLGGYAMQARTEALAARYQLAQAQARAAAEAGVMRAIYEMQARRLGGQQSNATAAGTAWIGDGRPYLFQFDKAKLQVSVNDEDGKVDLNHADPLVLQGLFIAAGVDVGAAHALAANIVEWRSPPDLEDLAASRQRYVDAGLDYGPRNGMFASLEELQAVPGMTTALYDKVAPAITLWSDHASPVPQHAPLLALASLPGMTEDSARQYIELRNNATPNSPPPGLPNGIAVGGGQGTNAKTILSQASVADGVRAELRVTVRFEFMRTDLVGRIPPYTILRWQEDGGS
jgi:general secretion pathway protein K